MRRRTWFRLGGDRDDVWMARMLGRSLRRLRRFLRYFEIGEDKEIVTTLEAREHDLTLGEVVLMEAAGAQGRWGCPEFLDLSDDARERIERVVDERVAAQVARHVEMVATAHATRVQHRPKLQPVARRRKVSATADAARRLRREIEDLNKDCYSFSEALDVDSALADLDSIARLMDLIGDWEQQYASSGAPPKSSREDTACWLAECLARSGVRPTTSPGGAFDVCLREALELAGEPAPAHLSGVLSLAVRAEHARQQRDGLWLFPYARLIFGESPEEKERREQREAERHARREQLRENLSTKTGFLQKVVPLDRYLGED